MSTLSRKQKTILVTGANGQLGRCLKYIQKNYADSTFIFLTKSELDITAPEHIEEALGVYSPTVVINTAAYTNVDASESHPEIAFAINHTGVEHLAIACKRQNIALIHISTDYVFDGSKNEPYVETDLPNPKTVYGASKLEGEKAIVEVKLNAYAIIRTSWLYSDYGSNFAKTMLRLSKESDSISIVDDQTGSPTLAYDLAHALLVITDQLSVKNSGVYHFSNTGNASWYAFAKAIFSNLKIRLKVKPITTDQYLTLASRPKYSALDCRKISNTFGISLSTWKISLQKFTDTQFF